ncbi:hypothetical protein BACERE00198_04292 [Bacillus cereus]|uniref:Uncharacterized protein n=1 Tax=Bacillus thuringiensis TaxID=1428 RepID=A0A9X5MYD2_BACTU|nr:hypothetical protein BTGOE4_60440 [Bacillus thuringiensis]SME72585.1 hypothetical protein BACERE00198_04292 [Bacillus cereus]
MACWTENGIGIEVGRSKLMSNAYMLKSSSAINFVLPVLESQANPVHHRTMAERLMVAERRHLNQIERPNRRFEVLGEPHCPDGVPTGIHPKTASSIGAQRFGITSRGTKTLLSEDPHSTIINGGSCEYICPDRYPYTAVCKLYVSYQPTPGAPWRLASQATG